MNQKFIKNLVMNTVLTTSLIAAPFSANAVELAKNNHKTMSAIQFDKVLAQTKTQEIAKNFGLPDEIKALNNTTGNMEGVVWVYHNAVQKNNQNLDALFMLVDGEMKYVTLSNAS